MSAAKSATAALQLRTDELSRGLEDQLAGYKKETREEAARASNSYCTHVCVRQDDGYIRDMMQSNTVVS